MNTFSSLSIPTSWGYALSAWMIGQPSSTKLAVLMPGFLDTKDYSHLKKLGEEFATQNFLQSALIR